MSQRENHEPSDPHDPLGELITKLGDAARKTESFSSSACIHKVPDELRKLKTSAYTPRLISIGHYHQKPCFMRAPMQQVKMSYANSLILRVAESENKEFKGVLKECALRIENLMDDANRCYAEEKGNPAEQKEREEDDDHGFPMDVEMMLVDGCFILELLYRFMNITVRSKEQKTADPILDYSMTANIVQNDLVLLENQIPFFVLEKLFQLTVSRITCGGHKYFSLTDYVSGFFANLMSPDPGSWSPREKTCCSPRDCILWVLDLKLNDSKQLKEVPSCDADYYHILHKVHDDYRPRDKPVKKDLSYIMPCASELVYAGVKFVPGTGNDLFKVKFTEPTGPFWWCRRARFEIPPLGIYDPTESFLRNLIAFEQCCPGVSQHFTSYAYLMDMLVNSDKDVQELEKAGVMHNYLGSSEDATILFNKLCKEVSLGEFYFADTCYRATKYSKCYWPRNMAHVQRQYFASPWAFIAFCLAFIVFAITVAQFVLSFLK